MNKMRGKNNINLIEQIKEKYITKILKGTNHEIDKWNNKLHWKKLYSNFR